MRLISILSLNLSFTKVCGSSTDLVDAADLTLDAVVLSAGATCPLVSRHVHTHQMTVSGEVLEEKTNTPKTHENENPKGNSSSFSSRLPPYLSSISV